MEKVLLTGASGLVGRNIVDRLKGSYALTLPRHGELDLLNYPDVEQFLRRTTPDMVIHCAGVVGGIQANLRAPVSFLSENAAMGMNVINASAAAGVTRLLNLGSSCMYPRAAENPLREASILSGELEPSNEGYALAKIVAARLCRYHNQENPAIRYKTLIPCNLYGHYDNFDPVNSHMIPGVIRKIYGAKRRGESQVNIWGGGTARREFMFAGEFAAFVSYAIPRYDAMPDMMNVGMGSDYSINEYYDTIAKVIGFSGTFTHDLSKPEGMARKLLDNSLQRSFGWEPAMTLIEGIKQTFDYYLEMERGG